VEAADPAKAPSTLRVAPSTATVKAGGKANLTTSTFAPKGEAFVGTYGIKVKPYYFKNETGSLTIHVNPAALRQLRKGEGMSFAGKAVTAGTGEAHSVSCEAVGAGEREGKLTIIIHSENGNIVFNTTYQFEA
jgi:hypothetical protein